ncbi:MAG: hypothetical protein ACREJL_00455 [Candidatus Methylomirabilales bacterium]
MDLHVHTLDVDGLSREETRAKILQTWLAEGVKSGKHRYNVERCADGTRIYLLRPAGLNKGCDFVIVSEGFLKYKNGKDKPPSHRDVVELIRGFLGRSGGLIRDFRLAAEKVYNCEVPDRFLERHPGLLKVPACAAERSLKLLRWMWIEQDVTYWTKTGREMLWGGVLQVLGEVRRE